MKWTHQHCCPVCQNFHFHEHEEMRLDDVTFRHRLCLVCERSKKITPEPGVRHVESVWAG